MGQRFQIITNENNNYKIYHIQWLWGDHAIRRIGTALKNYIKYGRNYYTFEQYLYGSFLGKPDDMNSIRRYFEPAKYNDNDEILSIWVGKKKTATKSRNFRKFLKTLDNNDGFCYIKLTEKRPEYCFLQREEMRPLTAEEYLATYKPTEGFTKKQKKELETARKVFAKLKTTNIPTIMYNNKYW